MLYSFVLCFLVCAYAAPPTDVVPLEKQQPTVIPIVSQSDELEPNGTYKFSYETGNGIKREEISYDKVVPKAQGRSASSNEGGESDESDEIHVQQGSYSYTAPDGTVISVRYIADENGFQPIGDHIPRVPALANSASSSSEKSSRALKVKDNSESASAPIVVAKPNIVSRLASEEESTKKSDLVLKASAVSKSDKVVSSKATTTEKATEPSKPEASTTLLSTTESESSTKAFESEMIKVPEATTASESSTTEAASTEASQSTTSAVLPSTQGLESSTTVAPSSSEASETTTAIALSSSEASESSSTVASLESSTTTDTASVVS